MFSLPRDPLDPDPAHMFGENALGALYEYETGCCYLHPIEMKAGVGYWVYDPDNPIDVSYQAADCDEGTAEVPCASAGWHMIGGQQRADVLVASCLVRRNSTGQTRSFEQAWLTDWWVSDPLFRYSCGTLGYLTTGVDAFFDGDAYLRASAGYWFYTREADLTLIVPLP